jgi:hypothetical protein
MRGRGRFSGRCGEQLFYSRLPQDTLYVSSSVQDAHDLDVQRLSKHNKVFVYGEEKYASLGKVRTSVAHVWTCGEQIEYVIDFGFDSIRDVSPTSAEQMLPDQKDIFVRRRRYE